MATTDERKVTKNTPMANSVKCIKSALFSIFTDAVSVKTTQECSVVTDLQDSGCKLKLIIVHGTDNDRQTRVVQWSIVVRFNIKFCGISATVICNVRIL